MEDSYLKPTFIRKRPPGLYGKNLKGTEYLYNLSLEAIERLRKEKSLIKTSSPEEINKINEIDEQILNSLLWVELGDNGADLGLINYLISYPAYPDKNAWKDQKNPYEEISFIEDFPKAKKYFPEEKAIRGAIKCLTEKVDYVFLGHEETEHINEIISELKSYLAYLEDYLQEFLDYRLYENCMSEVMTYTDLCMADNFIEDDKERLREALKRLSPQKLRRFVTHGRQLTGKTRRFWSTLFLATVNELRSTGYSDRKSYEIVATLYRRQWPEFLSDLTGELVRKRCEYEEICRRKVNNVEK